MQDLQNLEINNLVVSSEFVRVPKSGEKTLRIMWKCKCKLCNKEIWREGRALKKGVYKDCGCTKRIFNDDNIEQTKQRMLGKRFGWLEVIDFKYIKDRGNVVICQCLKCNENTVTSSISSLKEKIWCDNCRKNKNGNDKLIPHFFYQKLIRGAKDREIKFDVTRKQLTELITSQNYKCALSGLQIFFTRGSTELRSKVTASLDRIDSSKDYTIDNVQWVHKSVNIMKQCLTDKQLFDFCKTIYLNLKEKYDNDLTNDSLSAIIGNEQDYIDKAYREELLFAK